MSIEIGHDYGTPTEAPATAGTEALSARPMDAGHDYGTPIEAPVGAGTEALELAPAVAVPEAPAAPAGVPTAGVAQPIPIGIEVLPFTGGGATSAVLGMALIYAGVMCLIARRRTIAAMRERERRSA